MNIFDELKETVRYYATMAQHYLRIATSGKTLHDRIACMRLALFFLFLSKRKLKYLATRLEDGTLYDEFPVKSPNL